MTVENNPEARRIPPVTNFDIIEVSENGRTYRVPSHILAMCTEAGKPVGSIICLLIANGEKATEGFLEMKIGDRRSSKR